MEKSQILFLGISHAPKLSGPARNVRKFSYMLEMIVLRWLTKNRGVLRKNYWSKFYGKKFFWKKNFWSLKFFNFFSDFPIALLKKNSQKIFL